MQNDYLSHKILYGGLTDALRSLKGGERFALLDMGCGDAHYIASALKASNSGKRLSRYTGVDLAGDALKVCSSTEKALICSSLWAPWSDANKGSSGYTGANQMWQRECQRAEDVFVQDVV